MITFTATHQRPEGRGVSRLAEIWADITYAQRRLAEINRPTNVRSRH